MLTDLIDRILEIGSYDGAAPGSSPWEQTRCCDATVGKACAGLRLGTPEANHLPVIQDSENDQSQGQYLPCVQALCWLPCISSLIL